MIDIDILKDEIEKAFKNISSAFDKDLVLVLGNTGAGKSTTVNYLLEYPLKKERRNIIPLDPSLPPPAMMGGGAQAVTTYPAPYQSKTSKFVFCDCPGFQDTRGDEMRVVVSVSTEAVVQQASSISAIVAVIDYRGIEVGRGANLKDLAQTLGLLLKNSYNYSQSILFVINRASQEQQEDFFETIKDLIKTETQELEKEKAKQEKKGNLVSGTFQSKADITNADKERIDELVKKLVILELMQSNSKNVIFVDVLDKGESRQEIIKRLSVMKAVPKEAFDFTKADNVRRRFKEIIAGEMVEAIQSMKRYQEIPEEIRGIKSDHKNALISLKEQEQWLEDVKSGKVFKGEQDPIVITNRANIEQNIINIKDKQKELSKLMNNKESNQRQLWQLDTSDEVEFWNCKNKLSRSSEMKKVLIDSTLVGDVIKDLNNKNNSFSDNLFTISLGLPSSIILSAFYTPLLAPLSIAAHLSSGFERPIEYCGAHFNRVKEEVKGCKIERKIYEPLKGKYLAECDVDIGSSAEVIVTIYGEKRNKPDNSIKIAELKRDLNSIEQNRIALEAEVARLNEANKKLKNLIQEFLNDNKLSSHKRMQELEGLISDSKNHLALLESKIKSLESELSQFETIFANKKLFFDAIENIAKFISFDTELYPKLSENFISLHKLIKNSSQVSKNIILNTASFFKPAAAVDITKEQTKEPVTERLTP